MADPKSIIEEYDRLIERAEHIVTGLSPHILVETDTARVEIDGDIAELSWRDSDGGSYANFPAHLLGLTDPEVDEWFHAERDRRRIADEESARQYAADQEKRERATYEALRAKYG